MDGMPGPRLGALAPQLLPPEDLPAYARAVEALGFDELWVVEDCFLAGGLALAGQALAATERVRVGVGLLPVLARNPAIAAMEVAGLARMHPGRLSVAFGHGVEAWMRQIGARPPDRLVALREVVGAVRALLAGERLDVAGAVVTLRDVALDTPPRTVPPVLVGTTGARGLAIAGEVADGFLLPEGSAPEAVAWARERAGAGEAVVYAWLRRGLDGFRDEVEAWRRMGLYPELFRRAGLGDGAPADDDALRRLGLAGTAEQAAHALQALAGAGADRVVLVPSAPTAVEDLRWFAAAVRPLVDG
jgi:alkanesulfonate monooxygenase SsuD/methylene tetrahydromethanopterin reductase-like flavin-dependent oxidoreductase (luciferase family)